MTLEDFFTLTEMKDGLTAPSRVQELVSVMQKKQDCVVKNAGDATRQWAAVASTIAATEDKDCLDLFIQLDGLWFINRWLNDAQNFSADANDGFIEESITSMLRAVEKLHLDSKKSISSGIQLTVSKLIGHHSSRVQDRARLLFESWEGGENGNAEPHDLELDTVEHSGDKIAGEEIQPSAVNEAGDDDGHASGIVVGEKSQLRSSDSPLPEKVVSEQMQSSHHALQSSVRLDSEDIKEQSNHLLSVLPSVKEVSAISEGVAASAETCSSPVPEAGCFKGEPGDLKLDDLSKEKQEQNDSGPPENLRTPDVSLSSTKPEPGPVSVGAIETKAFESVKEPVVENNVENNEKGDCHTTSNVSTPASDRKSAEDDVRAMNSSKPQPSKTSDNDDDCCSNVLQDSSVSVRNLGKSEVLEMPFHKTEYVGAVKEGMGQVYNQGNDAPHDSNSFKRRRVPRSPKIIDKGSGIELEYRIVDSLDVAHKKGQVSSRGGAGDAPNGFDSFKRGRGPRSPNIINKSSNIELEYGIDDALAVARQVAQEVEREARSSSSDKVSEGGVRLPSSPNSIGKKDELTHVLPEEVSSRQSNSAEASSEEEGHMSYSDNIEAKPECIPDLEPSQVTEAARDPGGNSEKSLCTFDLNEEVGSDDMDVSVNKSATPIPVVSAAKPAQTSGLPAAPLQFEGTLGWKGSAVTSAFRPASPHKNADSEKNASVGGNSDICRQRQDCLDFDLNVAEGGEVLVKQIGQSSGLPSGQSSVEPSPKQSSRLRLDLNCIEDDGDTQPSDRRMEGQLFPGRNGYWSPSPASSSSSLQPPVRNIDLNDRPYFQSELVEQGPSKSSIMDSYGSYKSDAPVISILGAKVEVGRKEHVPQSLSLPNGKGIEPAIDLTMSTGGILGMAPSSSFNNSAVFGYNGLTSAPPLSFPSAIYGSGGAIPYMMDSRGTPVVPQVEGSSPTVLSSYSQHPFVMSMAGPQLGLNGVGPLHPNFDLNSGFMIDGGQRDTLAARQFFFPSPGRPMNEQVRNIPQSSSSGVSGKRKEPDSGWEPYPFSYKSPQPPWN